MDMKKSEKRLTLNTPKEGGQAVNLTAWILTINIQGEKLFSALKEIILGLKGHVGLFQKIRIVKPSPVERQCGLEIHHKTAPDESATAKDAIPACPLLDGSG